MATTVNVVTTDSHQPIQDLDARWCWWNIDELYFGTVGQNRWVPKVNDYVIRPKTFETWRVVSVDPITFIPTLEVVKPWMNTGTLTDADILLGVGPGTQAQLLRVYINRSSTPYKMTVDTHCFVGGDNNAYAVIYRNGSPEMGGEPVSRMYDNSMNFLGVEVPLELVTLNGQTNSSMKVVGECWTISDIQNGDPLTVIFYSADGVQQSKSMLLAENTTYIWGTDFRKRVVVSISLESPWLSASDANVLQYPLNIPTNALGLMGVVNYNSGPPLKLPVDGNKFSMLGLDGYVSSIVGQTFDLALIYNLSADEISLAGQGMSVNRRVTAPYKVVTKNIEPGYTVKLFMYPFWNIDNQAYQLRFWLYNLARSSWVEVTNLVSFSPEFQAFDPRGYGYKQQMQVNLNLRSVSAAFQPMIHTQMFEVTLYSTPQDNLIPWTCMTQTSPNSPGFGRNVHADIMGASTYVLQAGHSTLEQWLNAYYYNTDPLIDRRSEVNAPAPTSMWVSTDAGNTWTQYFIEDSWNNTLTSATLLTPYQNVIIRFTRPLGTGEMQLSVCNVLARPQTGP